MDTTTIALILIIILAGIMPFVYFRGEKANIGRMKSISKALQELLQPKDQQYKMLGTLVGFEAIFDIKKELINKVEAVLILLPRHSLVYFPISKLTSKSDKFIFKVMYDVDLHINPSTIERKRKFCGESKKIEINGKKYNICGKDINKLKNLLTEEDNELKLERLSYDNKLLFIEYFSSDERAVRRAVEIMKKATQLYSR
ncbi:MAG: hypothetical protein ACP5GN_06470 [Fervidicoccaceae archaeon]